jgi:hypothetical protein
MKAARNIIVYSFWFAFVLWLSVWFLNAEDWAIEKLLPRGISDQGGLLFFLFLPIGFICILGWLPIWVMKRRHLEMAQKTGRNITFFVLLLGCIFICTMVWDESFPGKLYNCTDPGLLDFLRPGDWIHGNYVSVTHIDPGDSMDMPDSIEEGWSVPKLWILWWLFIAASVAVSAMLSSLIFWQKKPIA